MPDDDNVTHMQAHRFEPSDPNVCMYGEVDDIINCAVLRRALRVPELRELKNIPH